jgi:spore germination protein YaaH
MTRAEQVAEEIIRAMEKQGVGFYNFDDTFEATEAGYRRGLADAARDVRRRYLPLNDSDEMADAIEALADEEVKP